MGDRTNPWRFNPLPNRCTCACGGGEPAEFTIVFAGFTGAKAFWNNTYVVELDTVFGLCYTAGTAQWYVSFWYSGTQVVAVTVYWSGAGTRRIYVSTSGSATPAGAAFILEETGQSDPFICEDFDALPLENTDPDGPQGDATCTISAVA